MGIGSAGAGATGGAGGDHDHAQASEERGEVSSFGDRLPACRRANGEYRLSLPGPTGVTYMAMIYFAHLLRGPVFFCESDS